MTASVAATVTSRIEGEVASLLVMLPRHLEPTDARVMGWLEELAKTPPGGRQQAFLGMISVYHLTGDLRASIACAERAKTNGASEVAAAEFLMPVYLNLGYASRAAEYSRLAVSISRGNLTEALPTVVACGAFEHVSALLKQARLAELDLSGVYLVEDIREIAIGVQRMNVPDADFGRVLDIAGTLMREEKLFFLENWPRYHYDADMEVVAIRYLLGVSPEQAADLNDELTSAIVDAGLEHVPLSIAFVGVAEEVEA